MTDTGDTSQLTAEQRARLLIDRQLTAAGWAVQDKGQANLTLPGVAVREVIMAAGHGRADYVLYVGRRAVGVVEAKPGGMTLIRASTNVAAIYRNQLVGMPIWVPSRSRQRQIVDRYDDLRSATTRAGQEVEALAARSGHLRRALLEAAFSGRLTGRSVDSELVEMLAEHQAATAS